MAIDGRHRYGGYLVVLDRRRRPIASPASSRTRGVYDLLAQSAATSPAGRRRSLRRRPVGRQPRERSIDGAPRATPRLSNADAGHARRAGLPRARCSQGLELYGVLKAKGVPARLVVLPRREPLDPEAAELAALVRRGAGLAREAPGDARRTLPTPAQPCGEVPVGLRQNGQDLEEPHRRVLEMDADLERESLETRPHRACPAPRPTASSLRPGSALRRPPRRSRRAGCPLRPCRRQP